MNLKQEYLNQQIWRNWQQYLPHIPHSFSDSVIDLGCSVGGVTKLFSPLVEQVIGVDLNPSFIAHCQSQAAPNEEFICDDISRFNFHSVAKLSGVWSSFVLSYIRAPTTVLSSIYDALEDGGWIALADVSCFISGNMPSDSSYHKAVRAYELESYKTGVYDFNFGSKIEDLLVDSGFKVIYRNNDVTDLELNFNGVASPEIIRNWQARLSRLVGMKNKFSGNYHEICDEIVSNLSSHDRKKRRNVNFVVARKS